MLKKNILLKGGLGNQMFQWAFYRFIISYGYTDTVLWKTLLKKDQQRNFELSDFKLFDASKLIFVDDNYFSVIYLFLFKVINKLSKNQKLFISEGALSSKKINSLIDRGIFFEGYWQKKNMVLRSLETLNMDFELKNEPYNGYFDYCNEIRNSSSVALHIRRGDYYNNPANDKYRVIDTSYYIEAIKYFRSFNSLVEIVVFTDDKAWVEINILPHESITIYNAPEASAASDLYLMSCFNNIAISNSSFSWWAATLGSSDKVVVCPKLWIKGVSAKKMALNSWTLL